MFHYWKSPDLGIQDWQPLKLGEIGGVNAALRKYVEEIDTAGRFAIAMRGKRPVIYVRFGNGISRYVVTGTVRPRYHVTFLGETDASDSHECKNEMVPAVRR
ncbi:MAG: hypothetical protein ACLP7P_08450 [Rhodomicrobium sp.]